MGWMTGRMVNVTENLRRIRIGKGELEKGA
jgi:hypothetical protein